jgi:WhiB family redox-sensing transcriptional regulator
MNWRYDAACLETDPEWFFPIGVSPVALHHIDEAKSSVPAARCRASVSAMRWRQGRMLVCGAGSPPRNGRC